MSKEYWFYGVEKEILYPTSNFAPTNTYELSDWPLRRFLWQAKEDLEAESKSLGRARIVQVVARVVP